MRITCEVQTQNRQLPSLNLKGKTRFTRSSLAIGKKPGALKDAKDLFIHVCNLQNKQGIKYKLLDNVQAVLTRFVEEGKFTIQLKEPSIDLFVKTEPALGKHFLKLLKLALKNKDLENLPFSHLNPVKQQQIEKPKTKQIILTRKDYPVTSSFARTLETLTSSGIGLNRIEKRITDLKRLVELDLSDNKIIEIPLTLGNMRSLKVLILKENKLKSIPENLFKLGVEQTLSNLDLSSNEIEILPNSFVNMKNLHTLTLNNNKLKYLPLALNRLKALKRLDVSNNILEVIPASLQLLHLEYLDVFSNPFLQGPGIIKNHIHGVCSLKEIAGVSCIRQKLKLRPCDVPFTLCSYLDNFYSCLCSKIVIDSYVLATVNVHMRLLAPHIVSDKLSLPAMGTFCSLRCFNVFNK